ncbi:MAG: NAD-binding protein [Caulobacterales bacterium]|jgi:hypothetical protein
MAHRRANLWAQLAAGLTAISHQRAPALRWGAVAILAAIWLWAGYTGWIKAGPGPQEAIDVIDGSEAVYRTLGALGADGSYQAPPNLELQIARFAGVAVPLVGLLLAFSAQLGRSMAQLLNNGATGHIVIAGSTHPALSLADDCVRHGDAVSLIAPDLMEETARALRAKGVTVLAGDASRLEILRQARAHRAAHVVAIEENDTRNLHVEAAVRSLVAQKRGVAGLPVHALMDQPQLLMEAREMRGREQKRHEAKAQSKRKPAKPPIDAKPFSLDEVAARILIQKETPTWLSLAKTLDHKQVHLLIFGASPATEALMVRMLMTVWSAQFGPPRITVVTPDPRQSELRFRARYPQAFAHPSLWTPDIAFKHFDWTLAAADQAYLREIGLDRGPATMIAVCTGADDDNIRLSLSLLRACNLGRFWPVPIYMHELSGSEFSRQYAAGDTTPELDAYLQAFGARELLATRKTLLEADVDRGAAIAQEHYAAGIATREEMSIKDLQAAAKGWADVLETYRAANRGSADSALIKLWDAGWRPALASERGDQNPTIPEDQWLPLAKREHDRWMAERLLSGWRAGERDNELLVHNNLKPWDQLTPNEQSRDVDQVKAALKVARLIAKWGFVRTT